MKPADLSRLSSHDLSGPSLPVFKSSSSSSSQTAHVRADMVAILNAFFSVAFVLQTTVSLSSAASATERDALSTSWLATSSHLLHEPTESSESVSFVCGSKIDGMDGKYVLRDEPGGAQSDANAPVFVREDDDYGDAFAVASTTPERDFRLFRHNGFWMFADVAPRPLVTHFRCDPTKRKTQMPKDANRFQVCSMNLASPLWMGYSPTNPHRGAHHLMLQLDECSANSEIVTPELAQDANDSKRAGRMAEL